MAKNNGAEEDSDGIPEEANSTRLLPVTVPEDSSSTGTPDSSDSGETQSDDLIISPLDEEYGSIQDSPSIDIRAADGPANSDHGPGTSAHGLRLLPSFWAQWTQNAGFELVGEGLFSVRYFFK